MTVARASEISPTWPLAARSAPFARGRPVRGDEMKRVVGISMGAGDQDFEFAARFMGQQFNVRRLGTNGSMAKALKLLKHWGQHADAIGLGVVKDSYTVGSRRYVEKDSARLKNAVTRIPVTTGGRLGDILQEWALRHVQAKLGDYFNNANVLFFSGRTNYKLALAMSEYTSNLQFADLAAAARRAEDADVARHARALRQRRALRARLGADQRDVLGSRQGVDEVRAAPRAAGSDGGRRAGARAGRLRRGGTGGQDDHHVHGQRPAHRAVQGEGRQPRDRRLADAVRPRARPESARCHDHRGDRRRPPRTSSRTTISRSSPTSQLEPRIIYPNGFKRVNRFAFVIHPLSQEYFKNIKSIDLLSHVSPPVFMDTVEKAMAYAPPFVYSKVTGIKSPTGVEAEGWLISVGGTPKEIMSHSPEFTYRRLLDAARMAKRLGAQIMGLGAFTKVVGDAGLTVARRAPLPITTGNSYSASGALWAAHDAVLRLGLVPKPEARTEGAVQGHGRGRHRRHRLGVRAHAGDGRRGGLHGLAGDRQAAFAQGIDPEGDAGRQAVSLLARGQGHRGHGHDRHRDVRRGQEDPRHHEGRSPGA